MLEGVEASGRNAPSVAIGGPIGVHVAYPPTRRRKGDLGGTGSGEVPLYGDAVLPRLEEDRPEAIRVFTPVALGD